MTPDPKPLTYRDKKYLKFIREKPCCVCGKSAEPHHESSVTGTGMGMKSSDYCTIPMCRECHTYRHAEGMWNTFNEWYDVKRLIIDYLSEYIQKGK